MGSLLGVEIFRVLRLMGQGDLVVSLSYLIFLGVIGGLMLMESLGSLLRRRRGEPPQPVKDRRPAWLYGLPLKMKFPRSRLYISVIPPILIGVFVGILSAVMGVGGGFGSPLSALWLMNPRARVPASPRSATCAPCWALSPDWRPVGRESNAERICWGECCQTRIM